MTAKLHINISQGLIDIEGDPNFVREIYADFRDHLLNGRVALAEDSPTSTAKPENQNSQRQKRRIPAKKKPPVAGEDTGIVVLADAPKLDKSLDTSALPAYFGMYEAKNNPEKILIFLKFMNDNLGIVNPNTDQFYTCFEKVNERIPKVFAQAFRDASGRKFGFIDYNSPTDIRITTVGTNHFKFDLKKKAAE